MKQERKECLIFLAVAYGLPFLMGIPMGILFRAGQDLSAFPTAQMLCPAAGLMLAKLVCEKEDPLLPKGFFRAFLGLTGILVLWCFGGFFLPEGIAGAGSTYLIMVGSLVLWAFYLAESKEKRRAYRLTGGRWSLSAGLLLLFVLLLVVRTAFFVLWEGSAGDLPLLFAQNGRQVFWSICWLPLAFGLSFVGFLGEEYGWRTYFQPLLQKKVGRIKGVFLFGVLWEFWHLPIVLFYYAPAGEATLAQVIVQRYGIVIPMAVFLAYAYGKTRNVWLPVLIHFANNHFSGLLGSLGTEGGEVTWASVGLLILVQMALFLPFLASKVFRSPTEEPPASAPD